MKIVFIPQHTAQQCDATAHVGEAENESQANPRGANDDGRHRKEGK